MDGHSIDVRTDRCSCRGGIWDSVRAGLTDVNFGGGDSQWPASNLQSNGKQLVSSFSYTLALSFIAYTARIHTATSTLSCPKFHFSWRLSWFGDWQLARTSLSLPFTDWMCASTYTYTFATMTDIHFTIVRLNSSLNNYKNQRIKSPIRFPFHYPAKAMLLP